MTTPQQPDADSPDEAEEIEDLLAPAETQQQVAGGKGSGTIRADGPGSFVNLGANDIVNAGTVIAGPKRPRSSAHICR